MLTFPALPNCDKEAKLPPVVSIFPFLLSRVIFPPSPFSELELMSLVVKLPSLVIETLPAFPNMDKEAKLPPAVIFPFVLSMVMSPPSPPPVLESTF